MALGLRERERHVLVEEVQSLLRAVRGDVRLFDDLTIAIENIQIAVNFLRNITCRIKLLSNIHRQL